MSSDVKSVGIEKRGEFYYFAVTWADGKQRSGKMLRGTRSITDSMDYAIQMVQKIIEVEGAIMPVGDPWFVPVPPREVAAQ